MKRLVALLVCFSLLFQQSGFCQSANLSGLIAGFRAHPDIRFRPAHLRSLAFEPGSSFTVLIDKGDREQSQDIKLVTQELMQLFMIGIALPDSAFWVNLRPGNPNDIIDPELARTAIGKIFLEADLALKRDVAGYTSPRTAIGKEYWSRLHKKADTILGTSAATIPTITRPWIVPGEIIIGDHGKSAFIYKATLKVMLEADYLKTKASRPDDTRFAEINRYASDLIKELVLPRIIKDINSAQRYASLRQAYYSLILAQWYKEKMKSEQCAFSSRLESRNIEDLALPVAVNVGEYFKAYEQSFKNGEYSISETVATHSGKTIRTFVSGGIALAPDGGISARIHEGLVPVWRSLANIFPFTYPLRGTSVHGEKPFIEEAGTENSLLPQTPKPRLGWKEMTMQEISHLRNLLLNAWPRKFGKTEWIPADGKTFSTGEVEYILENLPPEQLKALLDRQNIDPILPLLPKETVIKLSRVKNIRINNAEGRQDIPHNRFIDKPWVKPLVLVITAGLSVLGFWMIFHDSKSPQGDDHPTNVTDPVIDTKINETAQAYIAQNTSTTEPAAAPSGTTAMPTAITTKTMEASSEDAAPAVTVPTATLPPAPAVMTEAVIHRPNGDFVVSRASDTIKINMIDDGSMKPVDMVVYFQGDQAGTIVDTTQNNGVKSSTTYRPGSQGYSEMLDKAINNINFMMYIAGKYEGDNQKSEFLRQARLAIEKFKTASPVVTVPTATLPPAPAVTKESKLAPTAVPSRAKISPAQQNRKNYDALKDGGIDTGKGGIDFSRLPAITMPPAQLLARVARMSTTVTDIAREWQNINKINQAGMQPSPERLRDFLIACCKKGEMKQYAEKMLICLAKILRTEEANVTETNPDIRNMLIIVQAN